MKKKICLILLACCLLLTACEPAGSSETASEPPAPEPVASAPVQSPAPEESPAAELSDRARKWAEDLNYLKRDYKLYHKDPFGCCSEEEFNLRLNQLAAKVDALSDDDIYFELAAIVAGMGDTHTRVVPPDETYSRLFPVLVWFFGDRLYFIGYLEGYNEFEPYLLREIVAVNGVDIAYLRQKAESIVYPTNSWAGKEMFPFAPAFLDWAGCGYQEGYTFQILNENREVESVEIPVVSREEYIETEAVYPESFDSIAGVHSGDRTYYLDGENGGCVYLSFGPMENLDRKHYQELFEQTAELVEAYPSCRKLVIDLRSNYGGALIIQEYIREGVQTLKELPVEQVFAATGGYTMSAAMECLSIFKEELGAVIVGEPTGQFTSFFDYDANRKGIELVLPQTQLAVQISTGWYDGNPITDVHYDKDGRLYEWENTVLPDVYVYQDIEDIRQGKDSVIEWVLAQ